MGLSEDYLVTTGFMLTRACTKEIEVIPGQIFLIEEWEEQVCLEEAQTWLFLAKAFQESLRWSHNYWEQIDWLQRRKRFLQYFLYSIKEL